MSAQFDPRYNGSDERLNRLHHDARATAVARLARQADRVPGEVQTPSATLLLIRLVQRVVQFRRVRTHPS